MVSTPAFALPPTLTRTHGRLVPLPGSSLADEERAYGCGVVERTAQAPRLTKFPPRPVASLVWVVAGYGTYHDADGSWPLSSGACFLRRPGRAHHSLPDPAERWVEWWLRLPIGLYRHLDECGVWGAGAVIWQPGLDGDLRAAWLALTDRLNSAGDTAGQARIDMRDDPAELLAAMQRVVLLARRLHRVREAAAADDITIALEDAATTLADVGAPAVSLPELCRRYGIGYERFRKAFRARFGCAPLAWRNRHRLERATSLLMTGDDDLASIARAAGYPSAEHLAKSLRRATGLGPQTYRARYGQL